MGGRLESTPIIRIHIMSQRHRQSASESLRVAETAENAEHNRTEIDFDFDDYTSSKPLPCARCLFTIMRDVRRGLGLYTREWLYMLERFMAERNRAGCVMEPADPILKANGDEPYPRD